MKIWITPWIVFITLFTCSLVHGMEATIEVRTAAFYHTSKQYRDIYGDWDPSYQVEVSVSCNCCYALWANFSWFQSHGRSVSLNNCSSVIPCTDCSGSDNTKAEVGNLSFGIKFPFCICECLLGYVGIGPSIGYIRINNDGFDDSSKYAFGVIVKTGLNYYITQCLFLDLFVDYLYEPVHFDTQIDIGGLMAGVGLGLRF